MSWKHIEKQLQLDLIPLLRFLSSHQSVEKSPGAVLFIEEMTLNTPDRVFAKAFVHGALFKAWTGGSDEIAADDVFMADTFRISTSQYSTVVHLCHFEEQLVQCLHFSEWYGDEMGQKVTDLCMASPQLSTILVPFACKWIQRRRHSKTKKRKQRIPERPRHDMLKLETELLRSLSSIHPGQIDPSVVEPILERIVDLMIHLKRQRSDPDVYQCIQLSCVCLQNCSEQCADKEDKFAEAMNQVVRILRDGSEDCQNTQWQDLIPIKKQLRQRRQACTRCPSRRWYVWDLQTPRDFVEWPMEVDCMERELEEGEDRSELDSMTSASLGWALSQHTNSSMGHDPSHRLQSIRSLLRLICHGTGRNTKRLQSITATLYSILTTLETEDSLKRILKSVGQTGVYGAAVEIMESQEAFLSSLSHSVIRLMNQIFENGAVHQGVICDKEQDQKRLMIWVRKLLPFLVLFPFTTVRILTRNAILYIGQQRRLTQIIQFIESLLPRIETYLMNGVYHWVTSIDSIPAETLESFIRCYFKPLYGFHTSRRYLECICLPSIEQFSAPTSTLEGVLRGASIVVQLSTATEILPQSFALLEALSPLLVYCYGYGVASCFANESFIATVEQIWSICQQSIISGKDRVHPDQVSRLVKHCSQLDWYHRALYSRLFSQLSMPGTCNTTEIHTLLRPHCPLTDAVDSAQEWLLFMTQMLWYASISEYHASLLSAALLGKQEFEDSLLHQMTSCFRDWTQQIPPQLQSWLTVVAMSEMLSTASPAFLNRAIQTVLPCILTHFLSIGDKESVQRNTVAVITVEVLCRTLYITGSQSDADSSQTHHILSQGHVQLSTFCMEYLKEAAPEERELFIVRSFMEIATLMTSMKETAFDGTDLQLVLSFLLQELVKDAVSVDKGVILNSGIALHVVLQWFCSFVENIHPSSRNYVILAINALVRNKLIKRRILI